jgi:microcystin-dependent protein
MRMAAAGGTFNLPNIQERFPVGYSGTSPFDTLGNTGGAQTHTLSTAEMPAHTHTYKYNTANGSDTTVARTGGSSATTTTTGSTGSGTAFSILPPYIVINYIIKY